MPIKTINQKVVTKYKVKRKMMERKRESNEKHRQFKQYILNRQFKKVQIKNKVHKKRITKKH